MAKMRKRFYVAAINGGGYEILSLKFKPSPEVYSYSHVLVDGPFRTFDLAVKALENRCGFDRRVTRGNVVFLHRAA